jgi:diguanylate cyclase (GGDEF)-like protein/PAS domain S-box-containing protein
MVVDRAFSEPSLAELYDVFCPWEQRRDFGFYLPMVMASETVLDVGCGTGELLRRARQAGHNGRLCGLDPAEAMLDQARTRSDIEWILGDLAAVDWDQEFDLVVMTGHAFQVFIEDEQLRASLAVIRSALTADGRFAFDTRNPLVRTWEVWTPDSAVEVVCAAGAVVRMAHDVDTPVDGDVVSFTTTFTSSGWDRPQVSRSSLRFLDTGSLSLFLSEAGLAIEEQFGDWDRHPLIETSPEIITIARRAEGFSPADSVRRDARSGTEPSGSNSAVTVRMTRDSSGVITWVDELIVDMLGWQPEQLVGSPSTAFIHPEDQPSAVAAWMAMITSPGSTRVWRGRYQTVDGSWAWVETVNKLEASDDPIVSSSMNRVTVEQASVEDALRAREQLLSRLSDALPVGLCQIDTVGRVSFTNDRLHTILSQGAAATIEAQMSAVVAEDRPALHTALAAVLADQPVDDIEIRLSLAGGHEPPAADAERVCLLSLRALTDSNGVVTGAVGCLSDVTDRVQLRRELELRASVDELTSCLNRAASMELLARTTAARNAGAGSALIFIDLDDFKSVNDRFGHAAGDRLLVATVDRLRGALRDGDDVGRLGGDEFLVICPRVDNPGQALRIAERIAAATTVTIDVGPGAVDLRTSIGVAWTTETLDPDAFIAQADSAMYESKRTGRHGVSLFSATSSSPGPAPRQPPPSSRRTQD